MAALIRWSIPCQIVGFKETMLRLGHIPLLSLAVLAVAWPGSLRAGSLDKVWDVDLKGDLEGEHLGAPSYRVMKLLFSPDAEQIAVFLMGGNIELVRAQDPKTVLGKFKNDGYDFFGWSPDSQTVYAGRHVVHLRDQKVCDLPPNSIAPKFIGKGRIVALQIDPQPTPNGIVDSRRPGPAHLRFYDVNCQEQESWEVPSNWLIVDSSPDRGLLAITVPVAGSRWTTELIVSPFEKRILHSASGPDAPRGRFTDQGKVICGKICWAVDTGKTVVPDHPIRVVLDDYKPSLPFALKLAKRSVWDIRASKEVVSWRLEFITYGTTFDLDGYNRDRRPIPSAISPDGEYVVEGGDGKMWLFLCRECLFGH